MAQTYAYARQAGFAPDTAVIAAAIAMAESGDNPKARGDVNLETSYWGPSVGLMQIRTVKAQTGTGQDRDITKLSDPLQNMIAAYNISNKGRDFSPWTTFTSGKYRQFLSQAQASAGGAAAAGTVQNASLSGDLAGGFLGVLLGLGGTGDRLKEIGFTLLAIGAAGALVVLGGWQLAGSPRGGRTSALSELTS